MKHSLIRYFFPDLKESEYRKFTLLACTLFIIVGTYWLLRLLKNTIFLKIAFPEALGWLPRQGCLFQPTAKFWSPFVVMAMVLIYSKLIDLYKKHQLFYIICGFYGVFFALTAGVLFVKEFYGVEYIGKDLLAATGWISYFLIESFGSLVVALFWSFTNSICDSESAKRGFPLILSLAQFGAIIGSGVLLFSDRIGSLWPILTAATASALSVIFMIRYFMRVIPEDQMVGNKLAAQTEKRKEGFFEGFISGLTLLFARPYLLGVLVISTFYEVISQIVEYQMQNYAYLLPQYATDTAFARFQGFYGVSINILSFSIALLGTSYIIKRFGLRVSLLAYPAMVALTLAFTISIFKVGSLGPQGLLWLTFGAMVVIKGLAYALNNPVKEMMYIPTSKDAKFKSKGWIDTFGSRFSKSGGAQVNNAFKADLSDLMVYGTLVSFGLIAAWIVAALYVGLKNQKLIKENRIIE